MATEIFKGEKKLVEYELADSAGGGITFASLLEATVTLKDYSGNTKVYTKTGSTIEEGSTPTSIKFEITDTDLAAMDIGLITSKTNIETTDADFSGSKAIQIRKDELLLINA